ncbi:MAG: hypothetical protein M3362_03095 [Acidobacteriota bacterium]|nr:hypothetical protein [Acidobacteriota bacterium]
MRRLLILSLLVCASIATASAQDAVKADPQHYKVVYEDDKVRVLKVTLEPGARAESHTHPPGTVVHITPTEGGFPPYTDFAQNRVAPGDTSKLEKGPHDPWNTTGKTFEAIIVEVKGPAEPAEVEADAKPGETEEICIDKGVPEGWVLVDMNINTDFIKCDSSQRYVQEIKKVKGLPMGTELSVCKDSPVPEGWEVTGTSTDFTKCGRNQSFNNLKKIKRVK